MNHPSLKVKRLFTDAQLPVRAHPSDSGLDVFVHHFEQYVTMDGFPLDTAENQSYIRLNSGDRALISTGLSVSIVPGYEVQVRPKSGLALKKGLTVLNTPGTIDSGYLGPVNIIIINLSDTFQDIRKGEKIAQLVVAPVCLAVIEEVESFNQTARGDGGFGSTGL